MSLLQARDTAFALGHKTYIMGILNITPDSFSDGGRYFHKEAALQHALFLQQAGADILDVGAQSTAPGAQLVSAAEEMQRLEPILSALRDHIKIPISVDTFYPACARLALQHGAKIINDVSGEVRADMAQVVCEYRAGWILMHNRGGAHHVPVYETGVVNAVNTFFDTALQAAQVLGVPAQQICLDPGFGFGKSGEDNLLLLRSLTKVRRENALLVGVSRKRMLAGVVKSGDTAALDTATVAANTVAIQNGADILRVHNVPAAVWARDMADALLRGGNKDG